MSQRKRELTHVLRTTINIPIIQDYPYSRLLHHLAFMRGTEYMSAITVYLSLAGIRGMMVHFSSQSNLLGEKVGQPLHFVLAPGEYLTSAWVSAWPSLRPLGDVRIPIVFSVSTPTRPISNTGPTSYCARSRPVIIGPGTLAGRVK